MPRSARSALAATIAAAALVPATPALGATTTLTFEEFAAATEVRDQNLDAGGTNQGVRFGIGPTGPAGPVPDVTTVAAAQAQSGTKVGDLCDSCGKEFSTTYTWGKFVYGKQFVRVYVGTVAGTFNATLEVFDAGGNTIGSNTKSVTAGAGFHTKLEVTAPSGKQIAFFRVRPPSTVNSGSVYLYIDDVSFDTPDPPPPGQPPPPPPPPDFGLAVDPSQFFGDSLSVAKGKTSGVQVIVNRINDSHGPLSFAATGLPSGVTASFNPDSASDPTKVNVTFTAANNASSATDKPITIVATPTAAGSSEGNAPRTLTFPLTVLENYDLRVLGIELTQGIQTALLGASSLPSPGTPGTPVDYQGVKLVAHAKTMARVYANLAAPTGGKVFAVPMLLYGAKQNGGPLPGSPLVGGTRDLVWGALGIVTFTRRATHGEGYNFVLPDSWTKAGTIKLEAKAMPPEVLLGPSASECESAACGQNNSFKLHKIPFQSTGSVSLGVISMTAQGEPALPSPKKVLADAVEITPLADGALQFDPSNYLGSVDITRIKNADTIREAFTGTFCDDFIEIFSPGFCDTPISDGDDFKNSWVASQLEDAIEGWILARKIGAQMPWVQFVGVNWGAARGLARGGSLGAWPYSVVQQNRPITSVAHELHHGFGRAHASPCTKYGDPGDTENWPSDQQGFIQGIGFDRRAGSGPPGSPYKVIAPRNLSGLGGSDPASADFVPDDYYDLMSYCADFIAPDLDTWSSTRGWNLTYDDFRTFAGIASAGRVDAAAHAAARTRLVPGVRVSGFALPGKPLTLTGVGPAMVPAVQASSAADSAFQLSLRDGAGRMVAQAPVMPNAAHIDFGGKVTFFEAHATVGALSSGLPAAFSAGGVPSAVKDLQITQDGTPVAARTRSANAPKVSVRSPRAGQLVGRGRTVSVRWRATDADGDALSIGIDYSFDDGRTWRTIWRGPNNGSVRLSSRLLAGSERARLRVAASDGFNETEARSARFRAAGRAPSVTITSPAAGDTAQSDATLYLAGEAYDDAGRRLAGRALQWLDGRRRLGRGAHVLARPLPVGRHRLRLVARDRLGRTRAASIRLRVVQAAPQFLTLNVPKVVSPTARSLALRAASTVPAALTVSGAGVRTSTARLDRKSRRVVARITPGTTELILTLKLRAGGKSTQVLATIPRSRRRELPRSVTPPPTQR